MTRHSPAITAVLIAGLCLSACAPVAGQAAPSAPTSPESPRPTTTAAPSPSPTPEPDSRPEPRVETTCADLADVAGFSDRFGEEMTPTTSLRRYLSLSDFAQAQYGTVSCAWTGEGDLNVPELQIVVAPEVASSLWAQIQPIVSGGSDVKSGRYPGESYSSCGDYPGGRACYLHSRIGTWVLEVQAHMPGTEHSGKAGTWGAPIFQRAVDVVVALPPAGARWIQPTSVSGPEYCPSWLEASGILDLPKFADAETAFQGPNAQSTAHWPAEVETGFLTCAFQSEKSSVNFAAVVLPGGAWAIDDAISQLGDRGLSPVSGVGEEAFGFFSQNAANIIAVTDGALIEVDYGRFGKSPTKADAAAAQRFAAMLADGLG